MDRKQMVSIIAISILAGLTVTLITASSLGANTPLYTFRMEQASNKMNFLPTAINEFVYTTENGYQLNYGSTDGHCGIESPDDTYELTCDYYKTCWDTCPRTCQGPTCTPTCPNTCSPTCPNTCSPTCPNTCSPTCPYTCNPTCNEPTCVTCETCWETCYPPACPP